ncbi:MAG TPA: S41 family peptidase [Flavisolibacter sp.]|nr:S41 family peptidase [Flavisolibacter sp.]
MNYSGFNDKVTAETKKAYERLKRKTRRQASKEVSSEKCATLLAEWLKTFRDGHLYLSSNNKAAISQGPETSDYPSMTRLDDQTTLLLLPSFEVKYIKPIDSLVAIFNSNATRYLIIDIRGNGGGSDRSYSKLLPLLYTKPFEVHGVEFLASADNTASFEALLKEDLPADTKKKITELVDGLKAHPGQFVLLGKEKHIVSFEHQLDSPKRIAIIQDQHCASAAEQFLLYAQQSDKVTTFGVSNSKGVLDYANVNELLLPCLPYSLGIPSSRSKRLPQFSVDKSGIAPQVRLPRDERDVISVIKRYLSKS